MFRLPPQDHKAREMMGDLGALAEMLNPANAGKLEPVWKAVASARKMFEAELKPARVFLVVMRFDTAERWLISVGPKGGWRKEWNFGSGV